MGSFRAAADRVVQETPVLLSGSPLRHLAVASVQRVAGFDQRPTGRLGDALLTQAPWPNYVFGL